jgi:hypothetical protein
MLESRWRRGLALRLRELLQDLLEHLGGIILAALAALAAPAALAALVALLGLRLLLKHLHDLVQHAHRATASHYSA